MLYFLPPEDSASVLEKMTYLFLTSAEKEMGTFEPQEAKALLQKVIEDPQVRKSLKPYAEKIVQIYDRLMHLSNGPGKTWADGIPRDLLDTSIEEILEEDEEPLITHLKNTILSDVLLPKTSEVAIENDWIELPEKEKSRSKSDHVFKKVEMQPPDMRLLFLFAADEFGAGSELEGGQSAACVKLLSSYLKQCDFSADIIRELEGAVDPKDNWKKIEFIEVLQEWIPQQYSEGNPFLIMGGWTDIPAGHAIYYEVIPKENGKADFRLYNTGAGIQHHLSIRDGHKVKYLPYAEWKGVDINNITSDRFLEAIYEMKNYTTTPGREGKQTQYGAGDVYISLKGILNPASSLIEMDEQLQDLMMTPQRMGSCPSRSLMAFMRAKMPRDDYKRFKCDFKLNLLDACIRNEKEIKPEDWRLIRKTHQSVGRAIIKLYEEGLVGDAYLKSVEEVLDFSAKWIEDNKSCIYEKTPPIPHYEKPIAQPIQFKAMPLNEMMQKCVPSVIKSDFYPINFKTIKGVKEAVDGSRAAWEKKEDLKLHLGLIDFTKGLTLDPEFWKMGPKESEDMITDLGALSDYFLKSCFTIPDASTIDAEKIYVLTKLSYLQHLICKSSHPRFENLMYPHVPLDFFTKFTDPRMHQEMILMNQSSSIKETRILGNFSSQGTSLTLFFNEEDERVLEDLIREECPDVEQKITNSWWVAKLYQYPKRGQDAYIFESKFLPPWLQAMRDSAIRAQYIANCPVGALESIKRDRDIVPKFVVKDTKETSTTVTVTLAGVPDYLQAESKEHSNFIQALSNIRDSSEKTVFKDQYEQDPDFLEAAHLFFEPKLSHIEALEYFSNYPNRLKEKDYQTLLHLILFGEELGSNLKTQGFTIRLDRFIEKNTDFFIKENEMEAALFLLKTSLELKEFCPDLFKEAYAKLESLYRQNNLWKEQIAALMASALYKKEALSEEDVRTLILLSIDTKEAKKALIRHADDILKVLADNPHLLKDWVMKSPEGEFPYFISSDNKTILYPLLGELHSVDHGGPLPQDILENPLFKQLFPTIQKAMPYSNGLFTFLDNDHCQVIINMGASLIIEKELFGKGKGFYRFMPASSFLKDADNKKRVESSIGSRAIVQNYTLWQDQDRIVAVDPQKKPRYEIRGDEVTSFDSNLKLGKTSKMLASFEDPAYIHEWYNDQDKLIKIELPRFHLKFDENFKCAEFPDYHWDREKKVPSLGVHRSYLVLTNKKGESKVILPVQEFKKPDNQEVLLPRYDIERNLKRGDIKPERYFTYGLEKNGMLTPKSRESALYLAQVLATAGQYKKAVHYLKESGEKLSPYTPQEKKALEAITEIGTITGDESGNAAALRCFAHYLLLKQEVFPKTLRNDYNLYLNHFNTITGLKLPKEAEILILKSLLREYYDPSHHLRLQELDGKAARNIVQKEVVKSVPEANLEEAIDQFKIKQTTDYPYIRLEFITRAGNHIASQFHYYYELARSNKDYHYLQVVTKNFPDRTLDFERQWLQGALAFAHKDSGLVRILKAVLEHPEEFEPFENTTDDQIKKTAKKYAFSEPPVDLFKGDFTPKGFRLEKGERITVPLKNIPSGDSVFLPTIASLLKDNPPFKAKEKTLDTEPLKEIIESIQLKGPVANKEKERLLNDLGQVKAPVEYELNPGGLDSIQDALAQVKAESQILETLKLELTRDANKFPEDALQRKLRTFAGKYQPITLDELIVFYARGNIPALLQRNPALTETEAGELFNNVETYLLHATRDQHRIRIEEDLSKIHSDRYFIPSENPAYLAFEYFSNILMRSDQVEKLQLFLEGGDLNLVMEMIMGSGKSKVLLPLLGLLRADKDHLSMLIVPEPLFESVSGDTQNILLSFGQALRTLNFDRKTKFTKESLGDILDLLHTTRENRECLIMTSKSVQCLLLKYLETCMDHFNGPNKEKDYPEEIKLLRAVLTEFSSFGYPIIDEADLILNVLHEVSFSFGRTAPPDPKEFAIVEGLYRLIYTDPELVKFTCPFTTQDYFSKMQKLLASKFVDSLPGDYDKELLIDYLCRVEKRAPAAQKYYNSLNLEMQNTLALAGEEISHLLPFTLAQECNVKFGLDFNLKGIFAIPYAATRLPRTGSQYANPHVTMNYTFQTYMQNGITYDLVEQQIKLLQEKALQELSMSKGLQLSDTPSWKALNALSKGAFDIPFKYEPRHIQALVDYINGNAASKLQFVCTIILPQMELFPLKMGCNPQNLVAMFLHTLGFTGTLWNALSMHHSLKPKPAEGTDAKTLLALIANSRDAVSIIELGSSETMLKQLKSIDYDMICDAGGYFKDGSNREIAGKIQASRGMEAVFYDGEQMITKGDSEIPFSEYAKPPESRLTFLDQSHTTGADVTQKQNALSIVTIGPNMLLRDLLQSVWRLRGLDEFQKVHFILSREVAEIIRKTLGMSDKEAIRFDHILSFVIINQATRQGLDNYTALRQQWALIPQSILLQVLMTENIKPEARLQAFLKMQSEWIKPASLSAKERYGVMPLMKDSSTVIEEQRIQYRAAVKGYFKDMPWLKDLEMNETIYLELIDTLAERLKTEVPEKLPTPSRDIEGDQTVEVDTKAETEAKGESHAVPKEMVYQGFIEGDFIQDYGTFSNFLLKKEKKDSFIKHGMYGCHLIAGDIPSFSVESYFEDTPELKPYSDAFEGLEMTSNVLEWNASASSYQFFGTKPIPFHHLLVNNGTVTLMTQKDAVIYRWTDDYCNLTLGYNDLSKKMSKDEMFKIVQIKFLNGESKFDAGELKLLEKWFLDQGPIKMKTFYEKFAIQGPLKKKKAALYRADSSLKDLFKRLSTPLQ